MAQEFTIPGGKKKGTPITQADPGDIQYWLKRISDDLEQNPGKNFADRDRAWVVGARVELDRRKGGGAKAAPAQSIQRAPAQTQSLELAGDNPASVNQWFLANADRFHLLAPSTAVQNLPEGCEIAISILKLDPDPNNKDVYVPVGTSLLAPTATSLAKISQAAGIVWDTDKCGPVGDRSDPRYVEYRAVGGWKLFDGTFLPDSAHRAVDLRDGSDQIASMSDKQLAQARMNVLTLAETKAKNRVIRRLGLKPGYTAAELEKPFAVARLMWTGRSSDPELRRAFAMLKAHQMVSSSAALFGPPAPQPRHTIAHMVPAQPAMQFASPQQPQQYAPLPDLDDYDTSGAFLTSGEHAELPAGQGATNTPLPNERQQTIPGTEPAAAAGGKF